MKLFSFLLLSLFLFSVSSQKCFEIVKNMSIDDKCLFSRAIVEKNMAQQANDSSATFVSSMKNFIKCNGTFAVCGNTRSWVTEVFEGLASQLREAANEDTNGTKAGYQTLIGDDLINFFQAQSSINEAVIYHLRHVGTQDHVWTIEKLVNKSGYRIYQSYNDAYSLRSWLSDNITGYFGPNGDLMIFEKMIAQVNNSLIQTTNKSVSLNNLDDLPAPYKGYIDYFKFVRDYNQSANYKNFVRGWDKYGKGKILNQNEFDDYIKLNANITSYFNGFDGTNSTFPQYIYDIWLDLYSAPDPVYWPGYPNNFLTQLLWTEKRTYGFEVLAKNLTANQTENDRVCAESRVFMVGESNPSGSFGIRLVFTVIGLIFLIFAF